MMIMNTEVAEMWEEYVTDQSKATESYKLQYNITRVCTSVPLP